MRSQFARFSLFAAFAALSTASAYATTLPDPLPCSPCFIGKLELSGNPADKSGSTKKLDDDLYFVDPQKFVWKAGKGDVTDGASIPTLFQPIVGGPFEADFLPAAVIHDHYTDKAHRVRSWRDTARVFYQAMVVNGVPIPKAKTMYYAVYTFGPHWQEIAKGVPCGHNCVFSAPFHLDLQGTGNLKPMDLQPLLSNDTVLAEQSPDYGDSHAQELKAIQDQIQTAEVLGDPLSLDDLERSAMIAHSDNIFLVDGNRR